MNVRLQLLLHLIFMSSSINGRLCVCMYKICMHKLTSDILRYCGRVYENMTISKLSLYICLHLIPLSFFIYFATYFRLICSTNEALADQSR